ncbi:G-protein coupled receptor Mth2-like isoform X3 [Anthonomus grandis grandis]|uniref:G-protein coupled receptor Mth2-like isoform X3 n=1 Tax=Anthonomus grandis grandis TaxID=2921223 RepID=UPI002165938F|nr:G-protein coupled receptor Mth2-like isoform X3 [Anthonomus grandis grandis]
MRSYCSVVEIVLQFFIILHLHSDDVTMCHATTINDTVIRKCCPLGLEYNNKSCLPSPRDFLRDLENEFGSNLEAVYNGKEDVCGEKLSILIPYDDVTLDLEITDGGDLKVISSENLSLSVGFEEYCLDFIDSFEAKDAGISAFICQEEYSDIMIEMSYGMLISMPFLAITFIVYALLPDKNLYQYALMIYVLTLFLAYLQLVLINYITLIENEACILIGYLTLFSFTTSFFWLNVICFDIWFTFSRGRSIVGGRRSSEIKKLGFYSIYAFGVPLVLIILVYLLQTEFLDPLSIHNPKIGKGKCFLETGWPSLWYLYLEAGLIIIANLVFFSWTAVSIRKVKKETAMLKHNDSKRHAYEKSQKKFNLFIKLAFAMGINWSTEIISWFVNWQTDSAYSKIWIVTDCVNALYGVFIFFIFVFKKKTWRLLKRRYYAFRGKVYLAHSMGGTSSRPTNISTTESTVTTTVNGARRPEDNILLHDRR